MLPIVIGQLLGFLILIYKGQGLFLIFPSFLLLLLGQGKFRLVLIGLCWQVFSFLEFSSLSSLPKLHLPRCDSNFWFICVSRESPFWLELIMSSTLALQAESFRNFLESRFNSWNVEWGPLAYSMIAGGEALHETQRLYKNLGQVHVLVVSGSQFLWLSQTLNFLFHSPLNLAYTLTFIRSKAFQSLRLLCDGLVFLLLLAYLIVCGVTPPCQRAFLGKGQQLCGMWMFPPFLKVSWFQLFCLQMILFPNSWFTMSNVLSWGAVLCLLAYSDDKVLSVSSIFYSSLAIQSLCLLWFNQLSVASLLFSAILAPIWVLLLFSSLLIAIFPHKIFLTFATIIFSKTHLFLEKIDLVQAGIFGSSLLKFADDFAFIGRFLAMLLFVFQILPRVQSSK